MEPIVMEVRNRTVLGKQVKALRRAGITPANIFGNGIDSQAIEVNTLDAEKILTRAGNTQLVTLKEPTSKSDSRVLVKDVQRHSITGKLVHIDFYQVRMKDKVKVEVPLTFEGDPPAANKKDLILFENLRSLEVECLPSDIPGSIPIDLSSLAEAGNQILVKDLKLGDEIVILTSFEEVVARVEAVRVSEGASAEEEAVGGAQEPPSAKESE